MSIPLNRKIAEVYSRGEILVDALPSVKRSFIQLYKRLETILSGITPQEKRT
jgi:hypothetical protein